MNDQQQTLAEDEDEPCTNCRYVDCQCQAIWDQDDEDLYAWEGESQTPTATVEAAYSRAMAAASDGVTPAAGDIATMTEAHRYDLRDRVMALLEENRTETYALVGALAFTITTHKLGDGFLAHAEGEGFSRDLHRTWNTRTLAYEAMLRMLEKEVG